MLLAHGDHQRNLLWRTLEAAAASKDGHAVTVASPAPSRRTHAPSPSSRRHGLHLPAMVCSSKHEARACLPRGLTYRGSTRLNTTEAPPPPCWDSAKKHYALGAPESISPRSISLVCFSIDFAGDHACFPEIDSPLAPAAGFQWPPLQFHQCSAHVQVAYLCPHSQPWRNRPVRPWAWIHASCI